MKVLHEDYIELFTLDILKNLGYDILHGNDEQYLPGGHSALREDCKDVVLVQVEQAEIIARDWAH